ncbi:MAG TPA: NAD(P)H-binding protein [Amycolatopsis sp.]|uniref:NAD(P)H-binding protein n=1 Tax=Amycolatopsis nalaikhensis TaxID=715472 RepID=A0ABY8XXN6_9PSEU|nr:NAD(P)H-binding protein [Amycolatopsis sp. 2-2]WIV60458.1 NAD(P)H-binding protein [Amycolatopsis sp. 2-2]
MKLAVFGGAGLAGTATVRLALERGHHVRALVRGPGTLEGAEVVRGDALDPDAVAATVAGADAVVSSLGGYRGPGSIDAGTRTIAAAMRAGGPDRLVVLQGFHIDFPGDPHNPGRRLVEAFLSVRCRPLLGHGQALGELLRQTSDLSWTLVRVPLIADGPASGWARLGVFALGPWSSVRVGDVAETLVRLAEDGTRVREAPMLYTPRRGR